MSLLKREAKKLNTSVKDTNYRLLVTAGGVSVTSQPFKIVSSFSQLPKDQQDARNQRSAQPKTSQ
jgi:hypothetical protein